MDDFWLISDLHLGHKNIINYCERPFSSVEEHDEILIKNWNNEIKKTDKVFFLGDFCFGSKQKTIEYTKKLNGQKSIILGNHDNYHTDFYVQAGWIWASRFPIIIEQFVILSHSQLFVQNSGPFINIHGHCHNALPYRPGKNYWNVSADVIDFKPILYSQIVKEAKKEFELESEE